MKTGRILALMGVCVFASAMAFAQSGSIEGTITDQSGAVLPGVTVEASSPAPTTPASPQVLEVVAPPAPLAPL